jgi:MFS family permease
VLIQSVWFGISQIMAVLARKRFGAGDWQTLAITAAGPTLMVFSIFWNDLLRRISLRRYLVIHWACTMVPLACAAFAQNFWFLLGCHLLASSGAAGWSPIAGDLLKRFYDDRVRGRAFALVNGAMFLGMTLASYAVGKALDVHQDVFRIYLPAAAASYAAGVLILRRLLAATGADDERALSGGTARLSTLRSLLAPVVHMNDVLRGDRVFARYEAAFMTYGMGWMICNALLPILATDRLKMSYTEFAGSTQMVYPLCLLAMIYPMGWLVDRIGPTRTSVASFAWLALYPLGLLLAHSVPAVAVATIVYGTAMAGVHIAWMLGPVSLAPSPDKVAQYVAIHATLVGIRGIVAQGLGMLIYRLTGSFTWPLATAAIGFAWASWQMWRLQALMSNAAPPANLVPES